MATMTEIEKLAEKMAAVRDALAGTFMAQQEEIAAAQKKYLARTRTLTAQFKAAHGALAEAVGASPGLFERPRSVILHGIKAGFQKGKGALSWEDDARVVALIKKNFHDQADVLIKTTERPVKGALAELPASDLKRLGIEVEDTGDVVVVKLVDGDVAKMIRALLKGGEEDEE